MRYIVDHDLHIHSRLSLCSGDPGQTTEMLLRYGEENHFSTICVTNHMWDAAIPGASDWYRAQTFEHICRDLPLPQSRDTKFLFGCETEMDRFGTIGCSAEVMKQLDFIIIPTTHMHMNGFTVRGDEDSAERASLWCKRFDRLLDMELPFHKIGVAHLTCSLIQTSHHCEVLRLIRDEEYSRLFKKAAERGIGIELNFPSLNRSTEELETVLHPYRIAKASGCKFYFGSDAHHPVGLQTARENFEHIVDLLNLTEDDKIAFLKR